MGLSPFSGSSGYPGLSDPVPPPPNPNPGNFKILRGVEFDGANGKMVVVEVQYPDCTNYEGRKILVMGLPQAEFRTMKWLDPHFSEQHPEMLARFAPTAVGWGLACEFVKMVLGPTSDQ